MNKTAIQVSLFKKKQSYTIDLMKKITSLPFSFTYYRSSSNPAFFFIKQCAKYYFFLPVHPQFFTFLHTPMQCKKYYFISKSIFSIRFKYFRTTTDNTTAVLINKNASHIGSIVYNSKYFKNLQLKVLQLHSAIQLLTSP